MQGRFPGAMVSALILGVLTAAPTQGVAVTSTSEDPYLWLEEIESERALQWVRARNERSLAQLTRDPRYERFHGDALAILEDESRIPLGSLRDGWVYNFWQDEKNVRGVWRRSRLEDYLRSEPQWQTLLDVDALAASENRNWVFKGASCLPPAGRRCMIQLSDGGKDASVFREFDVESRAFVPGGFELPEAKSRVSWKDENTLLVATNWGPGTLTTSGYPFVVKLWSRGNPLSEAREIFRGQPEDVAASAFVLQDETGPRLWGVEESDTFFTTTWWVIGPDGRLERMTLPPKASPRALHRGQLVFSIEQDWTVGGRTWKTGSLLAMPLEEITRPAPSIRPVMVPGPRDAIGSVQATRDGLLVTSYSNVRGRLHLVRLDQRKNTWRSERLSLPDNGRVSLVTAEPSGQTAFVTYENFLQPTTLYAVDTGSRRVEPVRSLPQKFAAERFVTEQHEATSRDGTKVPYFVVRPKDLKLDGQAPTLLYAYGGFQVSLLPSYSATVGRLWLEQGGVYVLANIRGGGEFGPEWHQAGLKTRRQVVYDDFIAVAEDLIRRRITSPRRLGIQGGSNGGLLMGVMLTQRPELFSAAVVRVPLLDMLRYHELLAGASWVDEYGSPEVPEERQWLERLSPYHNLTRREGFPMPFLLTSTKDDRVHPGHARKFAARMEELGLPYLYYENIDGGHSAAANLRETARRTALEFTYLAQRLID